MAPEDRGDQDIQQIDWAYSPDQDAEGFPWGPHKLPLKISFEGMSLTVEESGEGYLYRRESPDKVVEKVILAEKGNLQITPVEPFHLPVAISNHLLIALEQPVEIEPKAVKDILISFPLELAVTIEGRKSGGQILDTFTLSKTKFSLYGTIKDGLVCKHWQSAVYHSIPGINPVKRGIMKLSLHNLSGRWAEIQKVVFSAQGMKLYYSQDLVSLKANMKILSESSAETSFTSEPLRKGMKKAVELYSARLLSIPAKTLMEEGY